MIPQKVMLPVTPDGAELQLLAEATKNSQGLLVLALGDLPGMMLQMALDRLISEEHLRLVDLRLVQYGRNPKGEVVNGPARVFKITAPGRERLAMLRVSAK